MRKSFAKTDRAVIKMLWDDGTSVAKIAEQTGFSRMAIYKELRRGRPDGVLDTNYRPVYDPDLAEKNYQLARFRQGRR